jgi:hypothetical protein
MYHSWRKTIWFKSIALTIAFVFLVHDISWAAKSDFRFALPNQPSQPYQSQKSQTQQTQQTQPYQDSINQRQQSFKEVLWQIFQDFSSALFPKAFASDLNIAAQAGANFAAATSGSSSSYGGGSASGSGSYSAPSYQLSGNTGNGGFRINPVNPGQGYQAPAINYARTQVKANNNYSVPTYRVQAAPSNNNIVVPNYQIPSGGFRIQPQRAAGAVSNNNAATNNYQAPSGGFRIQPQRVTGTVSNNNTAAPNVKAASNNFKINPISPASRSDSQQNAVSYDGVNLIKNAIKSAIQNDKIEIASAPASNTGFSLISNLVIPDTGSSSTQTQPSIAGISITPVIPGFSLTANLVIPDTGISTTATQPSITGSSTTPANTGFSIISNLINPNGSSPTTATPTTPATPGFSLTAILFTPITDNLATGSPIFSYDAGSSYITPSNLSLPAANDLLVDPFKSLGNSSTSFSYNLEPIQTPSSNLIPSIQSLPSLNGLLVDPFANLTNRPESFTYNFGSAPASVTNIRPISASLPTDFSIAHSFAEYNNNNFNILGSFKANTQTQATLPRPFDIQSFLNTSLNINTQNQDFNINPAITTGLNLELNINNINPAFSLLNPRNSDLNTTPKFTDTLINGIRTAANALTKAVVDLSDNFMNGFQIPAKAQAANTNSIDFAAILASGMRTIVPNAVRCAGNY